MERYKKIVNLGFESWMSNKSQEELKPRYIEDNIINLDPSLNLDLYRIISYEWLIPFLKEGQLSMSRPCIFKDMNEAFLLNGVDVDKSGRRVILAEEKNKYYVQSWSKREESEDLWRICSNNVGNKKVKLKSSAKKLMNALYDVNNPMHRLSYFIGEVMYCSSQEISQTERELKKDHNDAYLWMEGMPIIKTLFMKDKAYDYEDEIRLVFRTINCDFGDPSILSKWGESGDYHNFDIDFNKVIEEIVLHPGLNDDECEKMKAEIESLGYKGKVYKSKLYTRDNSP